MKALLLQLVLLVFLSGCFAIVEHKKDDKKIRSYLIPPQEINKILDASEKIPPEEKTLIKIRNPLEKR